MSPLPKLKKTPVAIKLAVIVAGLIVLAGVGYFALVAPKKNESKSLTNEITELDDKIREARSEATQAAGLSKIHVATLYKLQTAMPNDPKVGELSLELYAVAKATGSRFDSIQPGEVKDTASYQVIPITLVFQGSFYDLSDFLYRLQSLVLVENHELIAKGRLYTVDEVSFAQGEDGFPQIAATLKIDAYVFGHPIATESNAAATGTSTSTTTTSTSTTSTTTTPSSAGTTTSATS